ncbi:MAG: Double zinc ribbon [Gemmatimonadetes bacterium]|nr:Double zinc ribbon [Gemmatimonadota bacterium]
MQDIERLFRQLTRTLLALDPARLQQPVTVGELVSRFVPYRTSRRALGVESSEDYELLLLRFASGEGGFANTEPEPVRRRFASEVKSPNPDLSVLREFRDAVFVLQPIPLARVLSGQTEDDAYAPPPRPAPTAPPELVEAVEQMDAESEVIEPLPFDAVRTAAGAAEAVDVTPAAEASPRPVAAAARCSYCGGALPSGRAVHFCPHCGQSQLLGQCPRCKAEVEYGWRHCVSCGTGLSFDA